MCLQFEVVVLLPLSHLQLPEDLTVRVPPQHLQGDPPHHGAAALSCGDTQLLQLRAGRQVDTWHSIAVSQCHSVAPQLEYKFFITFSSI